MPTLTSKRPSSELPLAVRAATLNEALRLTRLRFGQDVRIVCSRNVTGSLSGTEPPRKLVEVVVVTASGDRRSPANRSDTPHPAPVATTTTAGTASVDRPQVFAKGQDEIASEVARIEEIVDALEHKLEGLAPEGETTVGNRFGQALLAAGSSSPLVARLLDRFVAETGGDRSDERGLYEYLLETLPTSGGDWGFLTGPHVFLGPAGGGRSEIVLEVGGRLQSEGHRTLVLSVAPIHAGESQRLQAVATRYEYDAEIVTDADELAAAVARSEDYDTLLIDAPSIVAPRTGDHGDLHDLIVQNAALQRHFVVPLDIDLQDASPWWTAARDWNCDWLTLTRLDRTARPGKLLDLCAAAQLPVSLLGEGPWPGGTVRTVTSGELLAVILANGDPDALGSSQENAATVAG